MITKTTLGITAYALSVVIPAVTIMTALLLPPTCTESGYTTHTCANCGNSYVDSEVPATGHSFKFFKCVNCGMHYGCKGANCVFCSIVRWLDGLINSCEIWLTEAPVSIGKWFAGIFNCIVSAIK